jgi:general secretion pathway protein A
MYTGHFGLTELPFSITPDPRYLYMSEAHREALAHLLYGIGEGGGFVQLTGEVGTGKTTLCRCLLEQLPPRVEVAFILNPKLTDVELLAAICDELRIAYPPGTTSRKAFVDALHHHLLDAHGRGHRTVLIIDEAQDLAPDVLEQIRLLTNLETTTQKLLQIILIGQPELIRILEREDLRQLAQRVTARYHLRPFAESDTRAYVAHRLEVAGAKDKVFSDTATRAVHQTSRGIPRLINAICDRALLGAFTQDERRVSAATVRRAAREVLGVPSKAARRPWRWVGAAIGAAALAAGAAVLFGHAWVGSSSGGWLTSLIGPATERAASSAPGPAPLPEAPQRSRADGALAPEPRLTGARAAAFAPGASSDVTPTGPAGPLGDLLDNPKMRTDRRSAFASLYARWRLDFDGGKSALGCERGRAEGLECLFKSGTWAKLRRYNLPAIVELTGPKGDRRYATVVALGDETATLDFGGQRYAYPLAEVDRYWEGAFIVLWKAPSMSAAAIVPGARGKGVEWVRQRLSEADGTPLPARQRDVYDDELRARVIAFQRARSLLADGIVGEETLLHLSAAPRDPSIPRLSQSGS